MEHGSQGLLLESLKNSTKARALIDFILYPLSFSTFIALPKLMA
jgi:hypothetical protein